MVNSAATARKFISRRSFTTGPAIRRRCGSCYERRPDVVVDYRPRFELKTGWRCSQIVVLVGGRLVRRYELRYADTSAWRPLSLLSSIERIGRDGESRLPPAQFDYTAADYAAPDERNPDNIRLLDGPSGIDLNDSNVDLLDVDADGLPDVIDTEPSPHAYRLNGGSEPLWTAVSHMEDGRLARPGLAHEKVRFADMNGDGRADLVQLDSGEARYYSIARADGASGYRWRYETPISSGGFPFRPGGEISGSRSR